MKNSKGIRKPHVSSSSTSDRRLASASKAASYLHSSIGNSKVTTVNKPTTSTAADWNPKHFRLFVGNLGEDANDALLDNAFKKYESMSKVHVPVDRKTGKNKGYGFVAFADANDYLKAFKEMNGKYIGQHPVHLKRAESSVGKKKHKK
ncbi:uncharacterized protein SPAPADRAFT_133000 [Spathaspora passalidarum NRRL Y-27907]|uniref:RRM domain-containing protein n=1 Tax=Spathaspora passalidarum (strain NRRL Y-27907 / 11-Y1) TaxID=619300 RepID=G3AFV1_SPAPN|nr:uncharacterized protein SPAPADRAFT_133000 [Spathaspora passalidarum NRRL Y-27907]EGW35090.1 hypothetical protein SPAPADRAFT_133000 [Spathaspora passalidarum NRRL Y-27907]